MNKDTKWIKIGPLDGALPAEMVGEVLKDKDIPYYISQDFFGGAFGVKGAGAVGTAAFIFVPEDFEEQASEIIEGMFGDEEKQADS